VVYAQNVTDVDDPLLERAAATGADWETLAASEIDLFRSDMAALRVIPPDYYQGVVESLDLVVALIARLAAAGAVYQLDDPEYPDWYCAHTAADLGGWSRLDAAAMEALFAQRGGDPDRPGKRHRLDALVWRLARPGEPSWDSLLGRGRPGWHVECVALAMEALGPDFDLQGGGSDLIFPHHTMCAAQALAATGRPLARAYAHVGLVGLAGEKMSKSQGNLVLVSQLLEQGCDPMALRLALLNHHYRADWSWTAADLARAEARLAGWRSVLGVGGAAPAGDGAAPATLSGGAVLASTGADQARAGDGSAGAAVVAGLRQDLRHDLRADHALARLDAWAAAGCPDPATVRPAVDALLGVAL
jgi:L-cysteine:1D-myo-inositol 2-amino-2-deoxy-alpha-D-glucopyranoside ligase